MLTFTTSGSDKELLGILALQRSNLPENLSEDEMKSQGFVTVIHDLAGLKKMNELERHVIAKDDEKIVAYLLAMTSASAADIPVLIPMFEMFGRIEYGGRAVSEYKYIVVGQVCVGKGYRGQGVLDHCYAEYRRRMQGRYDFAITEISTRNTRSIQAHKRIGFTEVHTYKAPDGEDWSVVVWQW
jgi:hypothetical protein